LGPASFAGPKTRRFGRRRTRKENNMFWARKRNRANVSAIQSRCLGAGKKAPIKTMVTGINSLPTDHWIKQRLSTLQKHSQRKHKDCVGVWA
jgi:hypothetical protein